MYRFMRLFTIPLTAAALLAACAETPFEVGRSISYCIDATSSDLIDDCPNDDANGDGIGDNDG